MARERRAGTDVGGDGQKEWKRGDEGLVEVGLGGTIGYSTRIGQYKVQYR